jgi:D-amino-acid dehydrogenase
VVHAFGHGHVGLTAGPMTGKVVAAIISDRPSPIPLAPYSIRRFA